MAEVKNEIPEESSRRHKSDKKCPVVSGRNGSSSSTALSPNKGFFSLFYRESAGNTKPSTCGQDNQQDLQTNLKLNDKNNMPVIPEQKPWPGQQVRLSTDRVISKIPKAEIEEDLSPETKQTWVYPSEQQFYNALKRKGWQPRESDMQVVVAIHNHVNDTAWAKILEWEQLHCEECKAPKLLRFMGKPKQLSPKATIRTVLGYAKPFDRHDWFVDRCGKEVRYVIDFYNGKPNGSSVSMFMDVRPALDSFEAFTDHIRMQFNSLFR